MVRKFSLTSQNADAWRGLLLSKKATPALCDCSAVSLAGGMELLATAVALRASSDLLQKLIDAAGRNDPFWHLLISEWLARASPDLSGDIHGTRRLEFFRLRAVEDKTSVKFELFLERFCRSMKQQGFPKPFANALSKVMDEIADNVVQHSGRLPDGFSGIAGYHVDEKYAAFAVVDVGRGILGSLKGSPTWSHLSSAREALRAIILRGASSRMDQGAGEGFRQVFGALIDRNSIIRLRTDDSVVIIADGFNEREGGELTSPFLAGLQLSISCALGKRATENAIFPA